MHNDKSHHGSTHIKPVPPTASIAASGSQAAVPSYLPRNLTTAAPGHRFSIYFSGWNQRWNMGESRDSGSAKFNTLEGVRAFGSVSNLVSAVTARQEDIALHLPHTDVLAIHAKSTSPFTTGLGIEHPVENGFAFLTPYGIPYLAGSGIKGVLRRAAEDKFDVGSPEVNALFGPETPEGQSVETFEPRRGALSFWDVIPTPPKGQNQLSIEIMTPHHSKYLNGGGTPNDSETPVPIPFLVVPQGWDLQFVITCDRNRLPEQTKGNWKETVTEIFEYAADTFGFGAKTAVGYGAVRMLNQEEIAKRNQEAARAAVHCQWVDEQLKRLTIPQISDPLRSKPLAEAVDSIPDPALKRQAYEDIRTRLGGNFDVVKKKAKPIYAKIQADLA